MWAARAADRLVDMIQIQNLTRRYGAAGITDVSFGCAPGTVTGFLGPNGAGKSTTMRILCGLERADSGGTTVLGRPFAALPDPGRRVGVLLDASAQHPGRTGRETLRLSARVLEVPLERVEQLLDVVGLSGTPAGRPVRGYSLGMRQRLALANALVGDPDVLVLDEPANGLDPEGIHWMRGVLREFAERGGTVLLSSHLLHEIEAVADRLVIINGGRIVADATTADLLGAGGTTVRALDGPRLRSALERAGVATTADRDDRLHVEAPVETVGRIALDAGVVLTELGSAGAGGLEQLFLRLTSNVESQESAA
jgi:ABC-2 type transport system ATP-binding protein